jgi:hypothetical protein
MSVSHYSVIRYVPDPVREEWVNIGVVVSAEDEHFSGCRFVRNWTRANYFGRENMLFLKEFAREFSEEVGRKADLFGQRPFTPERLRSLAGNWANSIQFSEPRASVARDPEALLEVLYDQYILEYRPGGGSSNPVELLEKRLRPLLEKKLVAEHYWFENSSSGLPRMVDFYANSTANVALDTLRLALKRPDAIEQRAAAEARKIDDLAGSNPKLRFVVYCSTSDDRALEESNDHARRELEWARALVVTDIQAAAQEIEAAVGAT